MSDSVDNSPGAANAVKYDWRGARGSGIRAIAASTVVAALVWFGLAFLAPPVSGMEALESRLIFAFKCCCLATLFCFALGIEAVAHERLQSAAFDPLAGHMTRRLQVNLRYLQNTLEQLVIFAVGLFGLALYSADGGEMRMVSATTTVWILARFAFWAGYHRSAAMRGIGAPGVMVSLLVLIYVGVRVGFDFAGVGGAVAVVAAFLGLETLLFRKTRDRSAEPA